MAVGPDRAVGELVARRSVFLVGDTSNRTNWGCRATTGALRKLISDVSSLDMALDLARLNRPLAATVAPRGTVLARAKSKLGWDRRSTRLANGIDADSLDMLAIDLKNRRIFPHIHDAIRGCDVVIVNGEGGVFERHLAGRLSFLISYAASRYFGKPTAIVNHTADLRDPLMYGLAERVYPIVDDVVVRECLSFDAVAPFRAGKPFALAADAAFALVPSGHTTPVICLGGSAAYRNLCAQSRDGVSIPESDRARLIRTYVRLGERLSSIGPVSIAGGSWPDDQFMPAVAAELGALYYGVSTSIGSAVELLSSASIYVGGRWHPSILALIGGTPVIALEANTDFKSRGILEIAQLSQGHLPAQDLDRHGEEIYGYAAKYCQQGQTLRNELRQRIGVFARTAARNVEMLT